MGIGVSIFLLTVGAILNFAGEAAVAGIDGDVVGLILMAVGALGLSSRCSSGVRAAGSPAWNMASRRGGRSWKSGASTTTLRCSRPRRALPPESDERSHASSNRPDLTNLVYPRCQRLDVTVNGVSRRGPAGRCGHDQRVSRSPASPRRLGLRQA